MEEYVFSNEVRGKRLNRNIKIKRSVPINDASDVHANKSKKQEDEKLTSDGNITDENLRIGLIAKPQLGNS